VLTGFPSQQNSGSFYVTHAAWYKVAASESGNYTITHATGSTEAFMVAVSGADTGVPSPNPTVNNGTGGSTTTATGLTTGNNGSYVLFISSDFGDTSNDLAAPTGTTPTFTKRFSHGTGGALLMLAADGTLATAGATGTKTITNNNTTSTVETGILIALKAAAGAAFEPDEDFGGPMIAQAFDPQISIWQ
jgi:hypothetical protein